ncbi:MAG: hypothetical protein U0414_33415 [Polyangiaceae bacterium]
MVKLGAAFVAAALVVGCGSNSGAAPSGSGSTGSKAANASGSTSPAKSAPSPSGSPASSAAVGGLPRVDYKMNGADLCVHADADGSASHLVSADEIMWKNGSVIKVGFLDGEPEWIDDVVDGANEWTKYANITFEWHKDPKDVPKDADELVTFSHCSEPDPQYYARAAGPASSRFAHRGEFSVCLSAYVVEVADGNKKHAHASAIHEFGHVLGLKHEQFNPNLSVHWDKDYVYEWCRKTQHWDKENCNAQVMATLDKIQPEYHWRATPFDKDSIMFYGLPDPNFTLERVVYPQPLELSDMDKKAIGEMYPKGAKEPDPATPSKGWDLETQIKKLKQQGGKQNYVIAVGVAEASDRKQVDSVVYIFPPDLAPKPVTGDAAHEQFIVQGKIAVDPDVKDFKVRAQIKLKDGTVVVVDKSFNLASPDGSGDIIKGDDE